jgi:hypothetical protein
MKLKSQKLIKHSDNKYDLGTPIKINKREKNSSVDSRQIVKDVKKVLRSPGFNIYLKKFEDKGSIVKFNLLKLQEINL